MIITIKTLENKYYDLDIDLKCTVAEIKEKIHNDLSLGEPELQKLIHHGKILKDDQTVESAGFKEKDYLLVMVRTKREQIEAGIAVTKSQVIPLCSFLWRTNMGHKKEMGVTYIIDLVIDYGIISFLHFAFKRKLNDTICVPIL